MGNPRPPGTIPPGCYWDENLCEVVCPQGAATVDLEVEKTAEVEDESNKDS